MLRNEALRKFGKHSRSLKCSRLLLKQLYFLGLKLFTEFSCQKRCPKASPALTILKPVVVLTKAEHHLFANEKRMRGGGGGWGWGKVSPRKSVVQSASQYDVTSRVSDFQNGEQSVHQREG